MCISPPKYYRKYNIGPLPATREKYNRSTIRELRVLRDPFFLLFVVFPSFSIVHFASCWYFSSRLCFARVPGNRPIFYFPSFPIVFYGPTAHGQQQASQGSQSMEIRQLLKKKKSNPSPWNSSRSPIQKPTSTCFSNLS